MTIVEQVSQQWELQRAAWELCVALYGVDALAVYAESLSEVRQ